MIEKMLKTVKSSSKKRGKNITIGAVVGMLLSCSAVIKADDYLWLKYDNGIKFSKDNGAGWKEENPYTENNWNGTTYTNNIRLYGENNDSSTDGYGLKLDTSRIRINLVNNGIIYGYGDDYVSGTGTGTGIKIESNSTVGEVGNNGIIYGYGYSSVSGTGIGINIGSSSTVGKLGNNGVIYGNTNAINNDNGTISNGVNYGLLISKNSSGDVVGGLEIVDEKNKGINKIANYGLAFTVNGSNYKTKDEYHNNFGKKIETSENIVINAAATVSGGAISNIESIKLNNGKLTYENGSIEKSDLISSNETYILNGIEDTLKVSGTGNELNNAVINAYKTAVNMSAGSNLTLGNTVINGETTYPVVSMAGDDSILSIEKNSKINGDISSSGKNNEITISESIINGRISATKDKNNTLNLIGNRDEKKSCYI